MGDNKFSALYYGARGYWKNEGAVQKLSKKTKSSQESARNWLRKQAMWQIYLPPPGYIPRPTSTNSNVAVPNVIHQADLLFLPYDRVRFKTYKYALTVVDVASRFKEAEPITSKTADQVADAIAKIYKRSPLTWPKLIKVDAGREFMGKFGALMDRHNVVVSTRHTRRTPIPGYRRKI